MRGDDRLELGGVGVVGRVSERGSFGQEERVERAALGDQADVPPVLRVEG
jgi:hypothetical protein